MQNTSTQISFPGQKVALVKMAAGKLKKLEHDIEKLLSGDRRKELKVL